MKLSESDRMLYRDAMSNLRDSEVVVQFVSRHISRLYSIKAGTQINAETGEIIEPETPAE